MLDMGARILVMWKLFCTFFQCSLHCDIFIGRHLTTELYFTLWYRHLQDTLVAGFGSFPFLCAFQLSRHSLKKICTWSDFGPVQCHRDQHELGENLSERHSVDFLSQLSGRSVFSRVFQPLSSTPVQIFLFFLVIHRIKHFLNKCLVLVRLQAAA